MPGLIEASSEAGIIMDLYGLVMTGLLAWWVPYRIWLYLRTR